MIVVVPLLVVVVIAGLWWALIAPEPSNRKEATPTPTPLSQAAPQTSPTPAEGVAGAAMVTATPTSATLPGLVPTATSAAGQATATPSEPTAAGTFAEGDKVVVAGTEGAGLRIRMGAGTGYDRIKTVDEGTVLEIVGGPKDANNIAWYQVRDSSGTTGWAAAEYLKLQE